MFAANNFDAKSKHFCIKRYVVIFLVITFVVLHIIIVGSLFSPKKIQKATHNSSNKVINDKTNWWRGQGEKKNATHPHLGAWVKKTNETLVFQMIVNPSPERLKEPETNPQFGINPDILCPEEDFGIEGKARKEALLKMKNGIKKYNDR